MAATDNVLRFSPARNAAPARTRPVVPNPLPALAAMWRAFTTRRTLAEMDDRMLADIGISRAQAAFEADRLPWDLQTR